MDLNPTTRERLSPDVRFLQQDCTSNWRLDDESLDIVFTSNFLEQLPDKSALRATMTETLQCLKP